MLRAGKPAIIGKSWEQGIQACVRSCPTASRQPTVPASERAEFCLSDEQVLQLARWAVSIEDHYSAKLGRPTPMDIEFAKNGPEGGLCIVQARPETAQQQERPDAQVISS
jgi:pyruvate,water dikinase